MQCSSEQNEKLFKTGCKDIFKTVQDIINKYVFDKENAPLIDCEC